MMDALEFLEMHTEMCKRYSDTCKKCPLKDRAICSLDELVTHKERVVVVEAVREWGENHSKTIGSDIEKVLPQSAKYTFGAEIVTIEVPVEDWDKVVYTDVDQDF